MQRRRFTHSSCPICDTSSGKCATTDDGNGVICWTYKDAVRNEKRGDYTCTKGSTDTYSDLGSIWFPHELAFTGKPADRLKQIYSKPVACEPKPTAAPQKTKRPLRVFAAIEDRHRRHSELLPVLAERFPVSEEHAEKTMGRLHWGCAETVQRWMQAAGFFSCHKRNQRLKVEWPVPGARKSGQGWELRIAPGLYGPMRDSHGHLLGWEVWLENGGKRPLSLSLEDTQYCPIEVPESGEQPIHWAFPDGKTEHPASGWPTIVMTEGKAFKPAFVAKRFGLPVLGCGGHMAGHLSPTQMMQAIGHLAQGGQLIMFADAGWLANRQIVGAMAKNTSLLRSAGYLPTVACAQPWSKTKIKVTDEQDETYIGADPDDLEGRQFWSVLRQAKPLEEWLDESELSEECLAAAQKGLEFASQVKEQEEHLRRNGSANRRRRHNLSPQLLTSRLPITRFKAGEMAQATIAELKELKEQEKARFNAWVKPRLPMLEDAKRRFDEIALPTLRAHKKLIREHTSKNSEYVKALFDENKQVVVLDRPLELKNGYPPNVEAFWHALTIWQEIQCWSKILRQSLFGTEEDSERHIIFEDVLYCFCAVNQQCGVMEGAGPATDRHLQAVLKDTFLRNKKNRYHRATSIILNRSPTGSSKSHTTTEPSTAQQLLSAAGDGKRGGVIYISQNYRSPSISHIEEHYTEVPARHGGLVACEAPNGGIRLVRATENSDPANIVVEANCRYAHRFAQLASKGHGVTHATKWCNGLCPYRPEKWVIDGEDKNGEPIWVNEGGDGSCDFPEQQSRLVEEVKRPDAHRKEWVQKLRTGPDGFLGLASYGEGFIGHSLVVIDETDQLSSAVTERLTLRKRDLELLELDLLSWCEHSSSPEEDTAIAMAFFRAFRSLLEPPAQKPGEFWKQDHGMSPAEIRAHAGIQKAAQMLISKYTNANGEIHLILSPFFQPPTSEEEVLDALHRPTEDQRMRDLEDITMPILNDLLRALMPNIYAADGQTISIQTVETGTKKSQRKERVMILSRRRPEFSKAIGHSAATLVLDATERPEDVLAGLRFTKSSDPESLMVGKHHQAHISVIAQADDTTMACEPAELKLFQVPCLGGMGRQRSLEKTAQRNALVDAWIKEMGKQGIKPDELGVLDHKPFCRPQNRQEAAWLTLSARGGNFFEKAKALLLVGMPIANLISTSADLELLHRPGAQGEAESVDLDEWLNHRVGIEFLQGIGRLRHNRRPGESLPIWIVSDANMAALCDQQSWKRPEIVEFKQLIGHSPEMSAQERSIEKVRDCLMQAYMNGDELPNSAEKACGMSKVSYRTFRKALSARNLTYFSLRSQAIALADDAA